MSNQQMNPNQTTREMKDSGIEWIGKIPKEWEVRKLSAVTNTITDFVASGSFASLKENVEYKDYPDYAMLVRTVDLSNNFKNSSVYISKKSYEFLSNSNLFGGELILCNIGSVGNVYYFKPYYKRSSLASNAILVRTDYCNKFYYYWFLNPFGKQSLVNLSNSAVQMKFNKTQLRSLKVPLPPLYEQQAISTYLDEQVGKMDNLISEQKQAIEQWKAYKQSLITETVTKGLNPNVEMKDSGVEWLGEIPTYWNIVKYKTFAESGMGETILAKELTPQGIPVYSATQDLKVFGYYQNPKKILLKGDFIIPARGSVGYMHQILDDIATCTQTTIFSKIKNDDIHLRYVYFCGQALGEYWFEYDKTTVPQLTVSQVQNNLVPIPPLHEQQAIADYLDEKCLKIDQTIEQKELLIKQLEEYKQSLIYECVTGKRWVR